MSEKYPDDDRLSTADLAAGAEREHSRWTGRPERARTDAGVDEPTRADATQEERAPLFAGDDAAGFRSRWTEVQTGFVDDPRSALEEADALVAEVIKRLADTFSAERDRLENQWARGDDVSTEELRLALQRYRSFFDRLLSV